MKSIQITLYLLTSMILQACNGATASDPIFSNKWKHEGRHDTYIFEFFAQDRSCLFEIDGKTPLESGQFPCTWTKLNDGRYKMTISIMGQDHIKFAKFIDGNLNINIGGRNLDEQIPFSPVFNQ